MNGDLDTPVNPDALLETFAAELTLSAYRVALQTRTRATWLELELELWKALADTVETWRRQLPLFPLSPLGGEGSGVRG